MFEALDHPVLALVRLRFGPISLGELSVGGVRPVTERELASIRRIVAAADGEPRSET
jgi:16S rRNA U516 pseudouridylate synthase RsuA-like enzyme